MKIYHYLILISLIIFGCNQIENRKPYNFIEANRIGIEVLTVALEKHGDFYSDSTDIAFEINCDNYFHPTQSQVPFHPMVPGFWNRTVWVSPKTGEEIFNSKMKAGSYVFHDIIVLQNNQRLSYNVNTKTFEENNFEHTRNLDLIPQTYLRKALENRASIKAVYLSNKSNKSDLLVEAFFDGAQFKLWFDQDSILTKVESLRNSSTYGQGLQSYTFDNNLRIKDYVLPSKIITSYKNSVWDEVINIYNINSIEKEKVVKFLEETSGYVLGDHSYRKKAEVVKLADNIYLIENVTNSSLFWSYNILFAEFDDYVLIAEAPVNNKISTLVMEKVKETIPDKPLKFLVQSHHHSDHLAGIKQYIKEGITIITSLATSQVIERINKAQAYTSSVENKTPQFQLVDQQLKIVSNSLAVIILDIGPTLHSEEMIIIYFPNERILYQADMLNYGEWPIDNEISIEFVEKIKGLNLPIDRIVGLHGQIINKDEIDRLYKGALENKFVK